MVLRYTPLTAPCAESASTAYSLQVGTKRQVGGRTGEIQVRYS
ncbi:ribonuclease P [Tsukamurella pseudospumae]|uniref:Ribonuclease P n=1 Tax=Tsukamurella pseudospumae TaxID=239498 RepID=A0A138AUD5_9ACTN|nr:ribonuclease P [Tsukamurella pseudospumae]KXP14058.1 ribonuclease P [Tsukamurella pseudospumae]